VAERSSCERRHRSIKTARVGAVGNRARGTFRQHGIPD
jgi:hypothetical protein